MTERTNKSLTDYGVISFFVAEFVGIVFGASILSHRIWSDIENSTLEVGKTEEVIPEGKIIIEKTAQRTASIKAIGIKYNPITGSDIDLYTITQGNQNTYIIKALDAVTLDQAMNLLLERCRQEQVTFFDIPKQYGDKLVLVKDPKCVEKSG